MVWVEVDEGRGGGAAKGGYLDCPTKEGANQLQTHRGTKIKRKSSMPS